MAKEKIVSEEVAHILHHVDGQMLLHQAEHAPGSPGRAQLIRNMLAPHAADRSLSTRGALIPQLRVNAHASVQAQLDRLTRDDDGQRLRAVLTRWVATGEMFKE